jgi:hypothetical protein
MKVWISKLLLYWNLPGRRCDECMDEYYNLGSQSIGCTDCNCNKVGRLSTVCDKGVEGLCSCRGNFTMPGNRACVSILIRFRSMIKCIRSVKSIDTVSVFKKNHDIFNLYIDLTITYWYILISRTLIYRIFWTWRTEWTVLTVHVHII